MTFEKLYEAQNLFICFISSLFTRRLTSPLTQAPYSTPNLISSLYIKHYVTSHYMFPFSQFVLPIYFGIFVISGFFLFIVISQRVLCFFFFFSSLYFSWDWLFFQWNKKMYQFTPISKCIFLSAIFTKFFLCC